MILNSKPPLWFLIHLAFPKASLEKQIFAFYPHIYSSVALSEDLKVHEETHLKQQGSWRGAVLWWIKYSLFPSFRVKMEVEAVRNQIGKANQMCLEWVKMRKMTYEQYRQAMAALLGKLAKNLSSDVYNNCVSFEDVKDLIRE